MENGNDMLSDKSTLQLLDWVAIGIMLAVSTAIGVYFRFTGGRQKTAEEYFIADRTSGYIILSITMMVAYLSATSLLGSCSENYSYGAQFNLLYVGLFLGTPIVAYVYLPVFYELQSMSIFEYINKRFGMTASLVASLANFFQITFYTGIVIYAPALALQQTTTLDVPMCTFLIGSICTFYSTIGGIKAVIITDLVQGVLMYVCVALIIFIAFTQLDGGLFRVIEVASEGGRLNFFDFGYDPTIRHTWWSLTIGGTFLFLTVYATSQVQVQRMLTARTLGDARKALFLNIPLTLSLTLLASFSGLVLYAYYRECDPYSIGRIETYDMLMPYFAKERLSPIPGLTGIFVAGVFSASLSTVSALLNSMAAVALSDYVKPIYNKFGWELRDDKAAIYGQSLSFTIGIISLGIAFLASKLGSLTQGVMAISGAVGGPILGLFTLGMLFESPNEIGAVIGTVISLVFNIWIAFSPKPEAQFLAMSTDGCPANSTILSSMNLSSQSDENFWYIDRISYLWYTPIGMFITIGVGFVVSFVVNIFSSAPPSELDPSLFTPMVAARIRRRREKYNNK